MIKMILGIKDIIRDTWASSSAISLAAIILHDRLTLNSMWIVLAIAIGYSYAYVLNDYFDSTYDKINPEKAERNLFVTKNEISNWLLVSIILTIFIILYLLFNLYGWIGRIIYFISISVPILYSAPPFRLKSRPGIDLITHALFVSSYPYFITVLLLGVDFIMIDFIFIGLAMLISFTVQLENQIRDFDYDVQNDNNFTIKFGQSTSITILRVCTVFIIICGILLLIFGIVPFSLFPAVLLLFPWLLHRLFRDKNTSRSESLVKITTYSALIYLMGIIIFYSLK